MLTTNENIKLNCINLMTLLYELFYCNAECCDISFIRIKSSRGDAETEIYYALRSGYRILPKMTLDKWNKIIDGLGRHIFYSATDGLREPHGALVSREHLSVIAMNLNISEIEMSNIRNGCDSKKLKAAILETSNEQIKLIAL